VILQSSVQWYLQGTNPNQATISHISYTSPNNHPCPTCCTSRGVPVAILLVVFFLDHQQVGFRPMSMTSVPSPCLLTETIYGTLHDMLLMASKTIYIGIVRIVPLASWHLEQWRCVGHLERLLVGFLGLRLYDISIRSFEVHVERCRGVPGWYL